MPVPEKLRWHQYGAVEVALNPEDHPDEEAHNGPSDPDMVLYARYTAPVSRPGQSPTLYDKRVFRRQDEFTEPDGSVIYAGPDDEGFWVDVEANRLVPEYPASAADAALTAPTYLFDAAAVLLWHDYELFKAADDAMGDASP